MERGDLVEVRRGEGLPCSAGIFEVAEGRLYKYKKMLETTRPTDTGRGAPVFRGDF